MNSHQKNTAFMVPPEYFSYLAMLCCRLSACCGDLYEKIETNVLSVLSVNYVCV